MPHIARLHAHVASAKENKRTVKVALLSQLPSINSFVFSFFASPAGETPNITNTLPITRR